MILSTENLKTYCPHIPENIKTRWVGPFHITREAFPVAFGSDLPLGQRIHPVFHVSKLKGYVRSEDFLWEFEPPPLVLVGDTLEYELEGILRPQGKGARCWYLVL